MFLCHFVSLQKNANNELHEQLVKSDVIRDASGEKPYTTCQGGRAVGEASALLLKTGKDKKEKRDGTK